MNIVNDFIGCMGYVALLYVSLFCVAMVSGFVVDLKDRLKLWMEERAERKRCE